MAEETYNQKINEFVDWVTGKHLITGDDVTGGLQVSGGRIRELLQERLQMPVYLYENRQIGKYQIFASPEAQQIYANGGPEELLLGQFDGPAAYKMVGRKITSDVSYLTSNSEGEEYIRFVWSCLNAADSTIQPVYSEVNVVVVNNGVKVWENTEGINSEDPEHRATSDTNYYYEDAVNILPFLQPGVNIVTVTITSELTAPFQLTATYNMIEFSLQERNFNPFYPVTDSITLIPEFKVSIETPVELNVLIDGVSKISRAVENKKQYPIVVSNLTPGEHVVVMYLTTQIQSHEYRSNVIVKQFVKTITDKNDANSYLAIQFNFANNSDSALSLYNGKQYNLSIQQYSKLALHWGLNNYANSTVYSKVSFFISDSPEALVNEELVSEIPEVAVNREGPAVLEYEPKTAFDVKYLGYTLGASTEFYKIMTLQALPFVYASYITEAPSFSFKFDAFGKNNASDLTWKSTPDSIYGGIVCTPVGVPFQSTNGWYDNSFRTKGQSSYLLFENVPFDTTEIRDKFTFEIDFLTEYIANTDEVLVNIGNFIKIYPNRAQLLDLDGNKIVETNYKAGERVHLTFVKCPRTTEPSQWSGLYMIITNGVFERATDATATIATPSSTIQIGGAQSGIRVFGMRYYTTNLDWAACYNNWIYDADNKAELVLRNMVFFTSGSNVGSIEESKCIGMMDTILVEGDLMQLVNKGVKLGMTVKSLKRLCPTDSTKNFTIHNCWIRTHGQSNIKYPVPSFKIWSNKTDNPEAENNPALQPVLELENISQQFCKARMQVYDGAIPANKWVLQSNFADSSCAHNGTFLRKWHSLTYNAKFKVGNKEEFKLRTPQQLFTSGETITPEDNGQSSDTLLAHGYNSERKQWKDYSNIDFPYTIRQAPNSFPALLFFRANESDQWTFFGQYVFMDDKKTDYEYGQRSIYQGFGDDTDPFVMKRKNIPESDKNPDGQRPRGADKYDKAKYRVWDNSNCIRIEVLDPDGNEVNFITEPTGCAQSPYWIVWDPIRANRTANTSFELIYPDLDDLSDEEVNEIYGHWVDFCRWVVSTKNNPQKFQEEAAAHLDLYKMGAYYVYFLFYGLVDSVNRNAQWKTCDGVHWWIEPWDMDIALGRKNDGGIAYDPPIDRQTPSATGDVGAFSGRDSVLWNHLEAWSDWINTTVPAVVQALYEAGMTYDNMVDMLDNDYTLKWPEYIYNKSGEYKYIYSGVLSEYVKPDYLAFLQGASVMQRHWWLSQSMDYWFSKFGRGAFRANYIKVDTNIPASGQGVNVIISPATKAFFAYYFQEGGSPTFTEPGYDEHGLVDVVFNITESFSTKKPFYICGLTNMEELDISALGSGFNGINLNQISEIHSIKVGATISNGRLSFINGEAATFYEFARATNIQKVDITGQIHLTVFAIPVTLTHFYAAASNFITGVYAKGNNFQELYLPNKHVNNNTGTTQQLQSLELEDCVWNTIKFFDTTNDAEPHVDWIPDPEGGAPTKREYYEGDIEEVDLTEEHPALRISLLKLTGKTCSGTNANNSRDLVMKWIFSPYAMSLSAEDKVLALELDHIEWEHVTKAQVQQLALFYKDRPNVGPNLRGKIVIDGSETITQEDLAYFQEWFGPQVFTLGSAGIVIDYPNDESVISVGEPAVYDDGHYNVNESDSGNDATGVHIAISYVHFSLEPSGAELQWLFGVPYQGGWLWEQACVGHPNVGISGVHDVQAERWRYTLDIKESALDVSEPYQFKIKVQGYDKEVLFVVNPATHSVGLQLDESSIDSVISNGTLLIRSGQSHSIVNAVMGGSSQVVPVVTWGLSGLAATALSIVENGNSVALTPTAQVTSEGISGNLNCQVYYPSVGNSVTITLPILIKEDQLIVDSTNLSLLEALNSALGTQKNQLYASEVAQITSLTLSSVYNYNTRLNTSIFQYLSRCANLTIVGGSNLSAEVRATMIVANMLALRTLEIKNQYGYVFDTTRLNLTQFITSNDSGIDNNIGVIASGTINLNLDKPQSLNLSSVNGSLALQSTENIEELTIINDVYITYPSATRWLGLIPSTTNKLSVLSLSNVSGCSVSSDQHELDNLNRNSQATITLVQVGNITVEAYYKYYCNLLPQSIKDILVFTDNDYYVLYNKSGDATKSFFDAWKVWFDVNYASIGKANANPRYGNATLGWTHKSLREVKAPSQSNNITLTLSGITTVEFDVYQDFTNHETINILNVYLTHYNEYDLSSTSVDPKIVAQSTTTKVKLGNPSSVTIQGGNLSGLLVTQLVITDVSNLVNVNISQITNIFTTVFGFNKTDSLVGTILGNEVIAGDSAIIRTGLATAMNNLTLTLGGSISAPDMYMYEDDVDAINVRFGANFLSCALRFAPKDAYFRAACVRVGIMSSADLSVYTWKTFWQAVRNSYPVEEQDTNFVTLCNNVVYMPESYLFQNDINGEDSIDVSLGYTGEPLFTSLKLICWDKTPDKDYLNINQSDVNIPTGWGPHIFKKFNASGVVTNVVDGVFMTAGGLKIHKYNGTLAKNYLLIVPGKFGSETGNDNNFLAYNGPLTDDNWSIDGPQVQAQALTGFMGNLSRTEWPFAIYNMMSKNITGKTLTDWLNGNYVYNPADFA